MFLISVIETNTLFLLAAASFFVGVVFREFGQMTGLAFYLSAVLLGFLLAPNKLYVITFAGMGFYIWGREFIWKILERSAGVKRKMQWYRLAKIDGASQMKIFWRIVVPISKPVFATIALFLTFGYWNDWFQSALYISDSKLVSLQALLNNMMKNLEYIANNPSAGLSLQQYRNSMPSESVRMAIAIIIVIPIACAYPFFQKYFISGLTVGAVKG